MKKWISILAVVALASGCATTKVSVDSTQDIDGGICQWEFTGAIDFESKQKGGGTAKNYQCILGNATIYRYNLGRTDWKAGTKEFTNLTVMTVKEILQGYKGKGVEANYVAVGAKNGTNFVIHDKPLDSVRFDLKDVGGRKSTSYLFLAEEGGEIIKYRISYGGTNTDFLEKVSLMLLIKTLQQPAVTSPVVWAEKPHN